MGQYIRNLLFPPPQFSEIFYSKNFIFKVNNPRKKTVRIPGSRISEELNMSKRDTWYGFLNAGSKSSPVVRDTRLVTKNPRTIYLYNHVQGKFLEYSIEIVEPKLRALGPDDISLEELKSAFKAARKVFVSERGVHKREIPAAASIITAGSGREDDYLDENLDDIADILVEDDCED